MERYRSLIVVASIALFVALVLGVGLFLLYPQDDDSGLLAAGRPRDPEEFDPIEYLRSPDAETPGFTPPSEEPDERLIIVYGDEGEESDGQPLATDGVVTGDDPAPVDDVVEPTGDAVAVRTTEAPERVSEPTPRPTAPQAVRSAPAVSEPRRVRVTEYWIQVISSPSRDTVEQAKLRLEEERLSGRITSKTVEGQEFYRLRVGPYSDKSEASKFLDWIREINDFAGSYISEEYPLRVVG